MERGRLEGQNFQLENSAPGRRKRRKRRQDLFPKQSVLFCFIRKVIL
jgi:hypothetical protein